MCMQPEFNTVAAVCISPSRVADNYKAADKEYSDFIRPPESSYKLETEEGHSFSLTFTYKALICMYGAGADT